MVEYWERSRVKGSREKMQAEEIVIHRRGADAVGMAMRRNPDMPKCDRISVVTEERFIEVLRDKEKPSGDIVEVREYVQKFNPWEILRGKWG